MKELQLSSELCWRGDSGQLAAEEWNLSLNQVTRHYSTTENWQITASSSSRLHHLSIISGESSAWAWEAECWTSLLLYTGSRDWLQSQPCTPCTCHGPAEPVVVHFTWTSSSLHQTSQQLVPGQTLVCQYSSLWRQHDYSPSHNLFKMP